MDNDTKIHLFYLGRTRCGKPIYPNTAHYHKDAWIEAIYRSKLHMCEQCEELRLQDYIARKTKQWDEATQKPKLKWWEKVFSVFGIRY